MYKPIVTDTALELLNNIVVQIRTKHGVVISDALANYLGNYIISMLARIYEQGYLEGNEDTCKAVVKFLNR